MITDAMLPILLLTLASVACSSQNKEVAEFIPEGYVQFDSYVGDLNDDGEDDCVLIIKKVDQNNIVTNRFDEVVDRNRRGIIVLLQDESGYQLADKNYDCFTSENEDGGVYFAPELWIEVENGNLRVHYGHGRYGDWRYVFRFQDGSFKLIGYDESSNYGPIVNKETSINFLTKKKLVRENVNENDDGGDAVFVENWSDIEIENLIELSEIEDFYELEMYSY